MSLNSGAVFYSFVWLNWLTRKACRKCRNADIKNLRFINIFILVLLLMQTATGTIHPLKSYNLNNLINFHIMLVPRVKNILAETKTIALTTMLLKR